MKRFVSFKDNTGVMRYGELASIDTSLSSASGGAARVLVGSREWIVGVNELQDVQVADGDVIPTEAAIRMRENAKVDSALMEAVRDRGGRVLVGEVAKDLGWEPVRVASVSMRLVSAGTMASTKVRIGNEMKTLLTLRSSIPSPPE
jgi:hypothetical protein